MKPKPKQLEVVSAFVTRYYDSLTDEEAAEDRAWGEFAATQFPDDEDVHGDARRVEVCTDSSRRGKGSAGC